MRPRKPKPKDEFGIHDITAGVDWLTFIGEGAEGEQLQEFASHIQTRDVLTGSRKDPWRFYGGYEGWQTASVRVGTRCRRTMLQASGPPAHTIATHMASFSGRPTRLDVQVSFALLTSQSSYGISRIKLDENHHPQHPSCLRRIGLSSDSRRLAIGTVGARTEPAYLRFYDKGIEQRSHAPGYLWRFELEAKQSLAEQLWQDLKGQQDAPRWCWKQVESQWELSGLPWLLPKSGVQGCAVRAVPSLPADALRLATWLRQSVAPTIPRVLTSFTIAELLELLGLQDLATPTPFGRRINE